LITPVKKVFYLSAIIQGFNQAILLNPADVGTSAEIGLKNGASGMVTSETASSCNSDVLAVVNGCPSEWGFNGGLSQNPSLPICP
jgi:hypothetical protein